MLPETPDPEWTEDEGEQAGTSYDNKAFPYTDHSRRGKACDYDERQRGRDHHHKANCASGGAYMLACFRAGAINLIVHPALQVTVAGSHKQGASTVQPVNSLPRAAFLDGAADQDSGDEPTSPVVTCIGQVKKDKPRTPPKTPPKAVEVGDLRSLKSKRERTLPRFESSSAPSSPARPSKWRQILGARGTVNPSAQPRNDAGEVHVDLNRFSSGCSSIAKTAPTLKDMKAGRTHTGTFLAKSLMMLQLECEAQDHEADKPCESKPTEQTLRPPVAMASRGSASEEVLLWKRRSGAKPLTLDLKRRPD